MSSILLRVPPLGEAHDRRLLEDASSYVYRQTPQGEVLAHLFWPRQTASVPRPAVVFFHGGLWDAPMPTQFVPHCLHFASRGAVAVAVETRILSKHGTGPMEAIEDAREAIRWLRQYAATFNLDPARVTIGGAAGGAFLALLTAMPKPKQLPPIDGIDCRPQALLLFSSIVNTTPKGQGAERFPNAKTATSCSPTSLVRMKLPPMLLFHGKSDRIAPFAEVKRFHSRLRWWRNVCELLEYERADHSFFNFNVSHVNFEMTVAAADGFLVKHGLLDPEPAHHAAAVPEA
ncbi:MAG: alpha/beta hydrolase [Verrucomicrobia bacterium]|nr:alpha/beta hydrolase [Verrucomicrobiota bacterium]